MGDFLGNSSFFAVSLSLLGFALGVYLKQKTKWVIMNPILISTIVVIGVLIVFDIDYAKYEQGSEVLEYLLTPTIISFAVPLYRQIERLKQYSFAVVAGVVAGVLTSLVCTLAIAILWDLTHQEYVTLLPKTITTAIGISVSEELGGIVTLTVAVIVLTGILGNIIGGLVCRLFRITDHVAMGVVLGTSAHAMGVAKAMEKGEVVGAVSSLSLVLAGIITVFGANIFASFQ